MRRAAILCALLLAAVPGASRATGLCAAGGTERWTLGGTDEFDGPLVAPRSQGVVSVPTLAGDGWVFSGLNGLMEKTDGAYHTLTIRPMPASAVEPQVNPDGTNHVAGTHIGDIDYYGGKIYASIEDGNEGQDPIPLSINDPEYQHPYIAVFDAQTLLFEGKHPLPVEHQIAGVPWVAADGASRLLYTSEWNQDGNAINVYGMDDFAFHGQIKLTYPPPIPAGFKLNRIQGMKVLNGALYGTRDGNPGDPADPYKAVYKVDLATGAVTRVFTIDYPAGTPAEVEGLAVRDAGGIPTLDVMLILDNDFDLSFDFASIRTELRHYALSCVA